MMMLTYIFVALNLLISIVWSISATFWFLQDNTRNGIAYLFVSVIWLVIGCINYKAFCHEKTELESLKKEMLK